METIIINILSKTWDLFLDASVFMIGGLVFSGILRALIRPEMIATHLGKGRYRSVFKSALFGIPIPLCSCGVLPAAISLKKQGANNGATAAFLISTPESGIDSISISWALLDPILTVARPVIAFTMALTAGLTENLLNWSKPGTRPDIRITPSCCEGDDHDCHIEEHSVKDDKDLSVSGRIYSGLKYSFTDVWRDIAGWFFIGLIIAGIITSLIPEDLAARYLGGGIVSMLVMLAMGIPIYICATASTPVAAAFISMGVSPGAALVFLLAGPATNITSLTVLTGILGKKTTGIYLATIAFLSVAFGLAVDKLYAVLHVSPQAVIGSASDMINIKWQIAGAIILLMMSVRPFYAALSEKFTQVQARFGKVEGSGGDPKKTTTPCAGGS